MKNYWCFRCHYNWTPRIEEVKSCPRCKSRNWNDENAPKIVKDWRMAQKGEKNHNWRGGVSQYPNHSQMKKVRKAKLEANGAFCEDCGIEKPSRSLNLHHIDGTKDNHSKDNLKLLCLPCHRGYHEGGGRPREGYGGRKLTVEEIKKIDSISIGKERK